MPQLQTHAPASSPTASNAAASNTRGSFKRASFKQPWGSHLAHAPRSTTSRPWGGAPSQRPHRGFVGGKMGRKTEKEKKKKYNLQTLN